MSRGGRRTAVRRSLTRRTTQAVPDPQGNRAQRRAAARLAREERDREDIRPVEGGR